MYSEEISTLFEAAQENFEVKPGQPTTAYLVKIRSAITSILLVQPYDEENGDHILLGLIWSSDKYTPSHGRLFPTLTRPDIYDPSITGDKKSAVVFKK